MSEVYQITTKEKFEETVKRKNKYFYFGNDKIKRGLAVCPSCDNPVRILGLYKKLNGKKPYAQHHNKSTEFAKIDKYAYVHCPYSNPNGKKIYDLSSKDYPITEYERKLYYTLREYFDKAVYMLKKDTDLYISKEFAKSLLKNFVKNSAFRDQTASIYNLPWIMLDNFGNFNLIGRSIKKGSDLWKFLSNYKTIKLEAFGYDDNYEKIVSNTKEYAILEGHFYAHTRYVNSEDEIIEKIKFGIIDSYDTAKPRLKTFTYNINEYRFPNLCKIEQYRNQKLLDIAKEIMPELKG